MCGKGKRAPALAVACALAAACGRGKDAAPVEQAPVRLGAESVATVTLEDVSSGPEISGTLRAEREATLRAELGGNVVEVRAQGGERVAAGQVLARIDPAALKDQLAAARSGVASARNAVKVAESEAERARTLSRAGAIAERDAERAESGLEAARAALAEAEARLATAQEQSSRTTVRAPFAGVVSARQVSLGDVVAPGAPLFTVIDPSRLELDAAVPAARLGEIHVGAAVRFRVTGFGDRIFEGKIERVNPAVDPATGQVRVYADVPNEGGELISGLYAQGRVATESRRLPAAPDTALDPAADPPTVLRVKDGKVERVEVRVALHDGMSGRAGFESGVSAGDLLVVGPARSTLSGGARVEVEKGERADAAEARAPGGSAASGGQGGAAGGTPAR